MNGAVYTINNKKYSRQSDEKLVREQTWYEEARNARARERQREFENLKMYAGTDNSAWPDELQRFMFDENRGTNFGNFTHLGSYNFIKTKINGIAGSLSRNPFDASYVADDSEQAMMTMALQQIYMSDKELMDWDTNFLQAYVLGLIYQSVIRMYPKTDFPANPMGNWALECMPPGSCILSPAWKTGRSKDLADIWTLTWQTVEEIKEKYSVKKSLIEQEQWLRENFGDSYESDTVDWNKDIPTVHGNRYLVVQHNTLKREKIKREIDPETGITFWEWMTDEQKTRMAVENNIDVENIKEMELYDNVEYIYTWAPGLSTSFSLLDTKAEFQLGRLKYFPWSVEWSNGVPLPMLDQLRDAQIEINKRVATISLAAESSVTSGDYIDEAVFGSDQQKIEDYKNNKGNPRYTAVLKAGSSRAFPNGLGQLNRANVPPDLFGITNMMIDLMDRLVPQPAASEGRSERSGESGILYAQKIEVAKTMQTTMLAGIRQLMNEIGEAYFFGAKQLYSKGRRTFTNAKGTSKIVINDEQYNPITGETEILNDFSALSRHRVVISEAAAGVNNRLSQRELNATLMQTFQHLPLVSLDMAAKLIKSLDMDDMEKEAALEDIELERERLKTQTIAAIEQAKVQMQQAQCMQAPPQQPQMGLPVQAGAEQLPAEFQGGAPVLEPGIGNPPTTYQR